jgi:hypothetical protein
VLGAGIAYCVLPAGRKLELGLRKKEYEKSALSQSGMFDLKRLNK